MALPVSRLAVVVVLVVFDFLPAFLSRLLIAPIFKVSYLSRRYVCIEMISGMASICEPAGRSVVGTSGRLALRTIQLVVFPFSRSLSFTHTELSTPLSVVFGANSRGKPWVEWHPHGISPLSEWLG